MVNKIDNKVINAILGIKETVALTHKDMLKNIKISFFQNATSDKNLIKFRDRLKKTLLDFGVKVVPFEQALTNRNKLKNGISVISVGEGEVTKLPVDYVSNPRNNPIVTIIYKPTYLILKNHFMIDMKRAWYLFAYYMANIIICISKDEWIVYSLNGFSPKYKIDKNFKQYIIESLVPKLSALLKPPLLKEFQIKNSNLNNWFLHYKPYINDILRGSSLFNKTRLYPSPKSLETLPFRNNFYKRLGRLYLDNRKGMSYGFFARQLPVKFSKLFTIDQIKGKISKVTENKDSYFFHNNKLYIKLKIKEKFFFLAVPDVWVITTRSGCNKVKLNFKQDLIKLGLVSGKKVMEIPKNVEISDDYKPSFDTNLILSHAIANAIFGSILSHYNSTNFFVNKLRNTGLALAHWHDYINFSNIPEEFFLFGRYNPAVCCSTYQASFYAFKGKEELFFKIMADKNKKKNYLGDIHVEPHHGINVTYSSLTDLAAFVLKNTQIFNNRKNI